MAFRHSIGAAATAAALVASPLARTVQAQQPAPTPATRVASGTARPLSLAEGMRIAERERESIQIARAGVDRARGQQMQARSQYLPQLNGSLQYTRALKRQFEGLQKSHAQPRPRGP